MKTDKRSQIVAAARSVFLQHGFSGASTDTIQEAAGVSKSTMYAHFENKETLFAGVMEEGCATFLSAVRALELPESAPLEETLTALGRAYLQIVLSREALSLFRVVIAEAPRFPDVARRFYLAGPAAMNEIVATYLDRATRRREVDFSAIGRDAAAATFVDLVRSEAQLQCLTHPASIPSAAQKDRWVAIAVTTFLRAYATRQRPTKHGSMPPRIAKPRGNAARPR